MKNRFVALKRGMAAALAAVLAVTALPATMPESAAEKAEATDVTLKNPRIVADKSMEAKQKVSWDCVYFGSYPQAEVIPSGVEYTALDAKLRRAAVCGGRGTLSFPTACTLPCRARLDGTIITISP